MSRLHSPLWPDRRVKPPYGSVEIDWGHPLAQALGFAYLLGHNAVCANLVVPQSPTAVSGGTFDSVGRTFASASSQYLHMPPNAMSGYGAAAAEPISIVCGVKWTGTASEGAVYQICANNGDANNGWAFGLVTSAPATVCVARITLCGINTTASGVFASPFNRPFIFGASHLASATSPFYVDGALAGSGTGLTGSNGSATASFRVGARQTGVYWNGSIGFIWGWKRLLSAGEHLMLGADPYCFLRPVIRRSYGFVGAGAGGAFKAFWARRRSGLIVPGGM